MHYAPRPRYLLDTSILVHLVRGDRLVVELEERFELLSGRNEIGISYVTFAEIHVIGEHSRWGQSKWDTLHRLLRSMRELPLVGPDIQNAYIQIDTYSRFIGRDIGSKNDIWIAATAYIGRWTLITTDKDFDHLSPEFVSVEYLDPSIA